MWLRHHPWDWCYYLDEDVCPTLLKPFPQRRTPIQLPSDPVFFSFYYNPKPIYYLKNIMKLTILQLSSSPPTQLLIYRYWVPFLAIGSTSSLVRNGTLRWFRWCLMMISASSVSLPAIYLMLTSTHTLMKLALCDVQLDETEILGQTQFEDF